MRDRKIGVAELEPRLAAERRECRHEGPCLAAASPAALLVGEAAERVHQGVEVRRDRQPHMLEIVAGIGHHHEIAGRQHARQPQRQFGATDAA
jgi:hypothetical protein